MTRSSGHYCAECGEPLTTQDEIDDDLCDACWDRLENGAFDTAHIHWHKPTIDPRYLLCECGHVAIVKAGAA